MKIKENKGRLAFEMSEDLEKKLKEKADEMNVSISALVRMVMTKYLKEN